MDQYKVLNNKQREFLLTLGEALLGVPQEELGEEFVLEADAFIENLEDFLQRDIKLLISIFNSRFFSALLTGSFSKFNQKSLEKRQSYYMKWVKSKIPLLRTGGTAFKAICGWSYYGTEHSWDELNYPGTTIGKEHLTPTLLYGKEPWNREVTK